MSTLLKSILQRASGNIARFAKRSYHTPLTTPGLKYSIPAATCLTPSDQSVSRLVQRIIIPFTEQRLPLLDKPILNITEKIDITPSTEIIDIGTTKEIEDPTTSANLDKKANMMIRIRRKKMMKHQRRKRRKKLAFYYKKIQKKRSIKKNTKFNNLIIQQLREVKQFTAEAYVAEKLDLFRFKVLPNRVHGTRLPQFAVKEWLEKREIRRAEKVLKEKRKEKFLKERGGTLDVDPKW